MRVLSQDQQRQELFQVSLVRDVSHEAAHVVGEACFPRSAVAVFPAYFATHGPNRFRSFAEGFEVQVERIVAVEMGEGIDAVAQALDEVVKLRTLDDLAVGFEERRGEETKRDA
jgi:hypothetical protein